MRTTLVLLAAACSQVPDEIRHPEPAAILIRVSGALPCGSTRCDSLKTGEVHRGTLIFIDADSLVLADRISNGRVSVREGSGRLIEIYRGQRVSSRSVATSTAKGGLLGLATGFLSAVAGVIVAKALGLDAFAGESLKAGAVLGAASGVAGGILQGVREGDAVWHRITVSQLRQELCRCADP